MRTISDAHRVSPSDFCDVELSQNKSNLLEEIKLEGAD